MSEIGLRVPATLPCVWERRNLSPLELEALWGEALLTLRVINLIEAPAAREGESDTSMARLEAKLDLALHLLALSVHGHKPRPHPARITLWAQGCLLGTDQPLQSGDEIVLGLYLSTTLPLPLKLAASVTASGDAERQVSWIAMPETVQAAWEQWLFRQHRRMVQGQRGLK